MIPKIIKDNWIETIILVVITSIILGYGYHYATIWNSANSKPETPDIQTDFNTVIIASKDLALKCKQVDAITTTISTARTHLESNSVSISTGSVAKCLYRDFSDSGGVATIR